jgi:PAS domain S-box-containing protein
MTMKENQNLYKDIESRVAEKENDLMILFKNMINAFVLFRSVFDENGKFVSYSFIYINNAYEKITGFKNDEVKGKTVHEV